MNTISICLNCKTKIVNYICSCSLTEYNKKCNINLNIINIYDNSLTNLNDSITNLNDSITDLNSSITNINYTTKINNDIIDLNSSTPDFNNSTSDVNSSTSDVSINLLNHKDNSSILTKRFIDKIVTDKSIQNEWIGYLN